jgi:hypothetical protein
MHMLNRSLAFLAPVIGVILLIFNREYGYLLCFIGAVISVIMYGWFFWTVSAAVRQKAPGLSLKTFWGGVKFSAVLMDLLFILFDVGYIIWYLAART